MRELLSIALLFALSQILIAATSDTATAVSLDDMGGITSLLSTRAIAQDEDGAIWFGTDKCLYSFDGYKVKAHPDGLGHIQVNCITIIGRTVHLGSNEGLYCYDMDTDKYTEISYFENDPVRALILNDDVLYVAPSQACTHTDGLSLLHPHRYQGYVRMKYIHWQAAPERFGSAP